MATSAKMDIKAARAAFPNAGLMPRDETNASQFVREHAEWDGRGVKIAILDTGVDPAAVGLQITADGRPKVVDIVDATGSGDVIMHAEAEAASELSDGKGGSIRTLTGCTGRQLRLNPEWINPSNKWRLGAKQVAQLYANSLKSRVSGESGKANAAEANALIADAEQRLADWRADTGITAVDAKTVPDSSHRAELEELLGALEAAKQASSHVSKPDTDVDVMDVVAWHDGTTWRAAVDSSRAGDMTAAPGMANFRQHREYATLDRRSQLSYCLNTYDEGTIVSIVCDAGSHGTHVAGITAGFHPSSPELNGVAPGAQIVAVKIGDSRLGSMETNQGLMRGMRAVVENECDLVNLSYGEPTPWPAAGRLVQQISDAVRRRGVIFVTSAGNAGPALSTVGGPAACSPSMIAVGAAVSNTMAAAGYGTRRSPSLTLYSWSSRGPVMDGSLGVSICAPGCARAPVPVWNLSKSMHMNGTSMASPNACGCIALLLSAAKASGLAYTPHSVRRCLENGAKPIEGCTVWGLGRGLLDVPRSWALMTRGAEVAEAEKAAQAAAAREQGFADAAAPPMAPGPPLGTGVLARAAAAAAAAASTGGDTSTTSDAAQGWQGTDSASPDADPDTTLIPTWARGVVGASRFRILHPTDVPVASIPVGCHLGEARGEDFSIPELLVSVAHGGVGAGSALDRGVYLRDEAQSAAASTVNISVSAKWHPAVHERSRLLFERRYALASTSPWVSVASHATVTSAGGSFQARIDPTALPAGAHYAEIRGYRVTASRSRTDQGPDFFVPITIVRPERPLAGDACPTYTFTALPSGSQTLVSTNDPAAADATAAFSASKALAATSAAACSVQAPQARGSSSSGGFAEPGATAAPFRRPAFVVTPAEYARRFVAVPHGVTWCELSVKRVDRGNDDDSGAAARADARTRTAQAASAAAADGARAPGPSFAPVGAPGAGTAGAIPTFSSGADASWYDSTGILGADAGRGQSGDSQLLQAEDDTSGSAADTTGRIILMHCMQVVPHTSEKLTVKEVYARMGPGDEASLVMPVVPGRTIEAVCGQYWSSTGSTLLTATLRFRGVSLPRSIAFAPVDGAGRVDLFASTHPVVVRPSAQFTALRRALAPVEAVIDTLGERDYDERGAPLYRLRLRYNYTPAEAESVSAVVSGVQGHLYDSPHMCQGILFIETDKALAGGATQALGVTAKAPASSGVAGRFVGFSDAFSDAVALAKGRPHAIVAQIVSPTRAHLESCKALTLTLTSKLSKPISASVFGSFCGISTFPAGSRPAAPTKLLPGEHMSLFIEAVKPADTPKGASPGSQLLGELSVASYSGKATSGDGKCPSGDAKLVFTVTAATGDPADPEPITAAAPGTPAAAAAAAAAAGAASSAASSSSLAVASASSASIEASVHEAVRDASIAALAKLNGDAFDILYDTLAAESPSHLPLLLALLKKRAAGVNPTAASATEDTGAAAEARTATHGVVADILKATVPADVHAYFAKRYEEAEATAEDKAHRKTMEERREATKEALWAACQGRMHHIAAAAAAGAAGGAWEPSSSAGAAATAAFLASLRELRDWVDTSKAAYRLAELEEALCKEQPGKALAALTAILGEPRADADKVAPAEALRAARLALARSLAVEASSRATRFAGTAARGWELCIARFEADDAAARVRCQHIF